MHILEYQNHSWFAHGRFEVEGISDSEGLFKTSTVSAYYVLLPTAIIYVNIKDFLDN